MAQFLSYISYVAVILSMSQIHGSDDSLGKDKKFLRYQDSRLKTHEEVLREREAALELLNMIRRDPYDGDYPRYERTDKYKTTDHKS